jgi:transcriptional regulator with XRE-family HTH domain
MDTGENIILEPDAGGTAVLIRTARARADLSQRQLAARAGTSQPAIARYESGRVEPDLSTLRRLLTACGFTLRLRVEPLDPDDLRRLREAVGARVEYRVESNRRATRLAAEAAGAWRDGRVRRLRDA